MLSTLICFGTDANLKATDDINYYINELGEFEEKVEYDTILNILKDNNIPKISQENPFNQVDAMIFSEIVYLPMNIIENIDLETDYYMNIFFEKENNNDNKEKLTIKEFYDRMNNMFTEKDILKFSVHDQDNNNCKNYVNNYIPGQEDWRTKKLMLLEYMSKQDRYKDIIISDFCGKYKDINQDEPEQFAVVTYELGEEFGKDIKLVAFRGTDSTLAGWKEDADMSWDEEIPSQKDAARYLEYVCKKYPNSNFYVAGHSKGGNLAMYSALKLCSKNELYMDRIISVFNFDGPGIRSDIAEKYKFMFKILSKNFLIFLPQASVIGRMMQSSSYDNSKITYVYSQASGGLSQHYLYSWEVNKLFYKKKARKFNLTTEVPESELMYDIWEYLLKYAQKSYLRVFFEIVFKFLNENDISFESNESIWDVIGRLVHKYKSSAEDLIEIVFSKEKQDGKVEIFKNVMDLIMESLISSYWDKYKKVNQSLNLPDNINNILDDIRESGYTYTNWKGIVWAVLNKVFDFSFIIDLVRNWI